MQTKDGFEIPQLPDEFVRDMRNDSISDSEFARSINAVLGESSEVLRFMFYTELPSYRPNLFERLSIARLKAEESRNIKFFLQDLKSEDVSTDRFAQLFILLCDPHTGEYADNPDFLGMLFGLTKIYRPSMCILPVAVMIMNKGSHPPI